MNNKCKICGQNLNFLYYKVGNFKAWIGTCPGCGRYVRRYAFNFEGDTIVENNKIIDCLMTCSGDSTEHKIDFKIPALIRVRE